MEHDALVNRGFIVRAGSRPPDGGGSTIIVSGVARSGTTMLAGMLREAGLHMGTFLADVVHEDRQLLAILQSGQRQLLVSAIAERNAAHQDWGFKIPNLHAYLHLADLARFRNPRIVLIFRDPVAVAVRNAISEMFDEFSTLAETAAAELAVVEFARAADCPLLLVSYEKALIFPEMLVDAIAAFCSLQPDEAQRARMIELVQPNPDGYLRHARRQFTGSIETLRNGKLHGWFCQIGELEPVELDLYLDHEKIVTVKADRFRPDLRDAGFGNGNHGFSIDLRGLTARMDATVRLRVHGRVAEVPRSGRRLAEYTQRETPAVTRVSGAPLIEPAAPEKPPVGRKLVRAAKAMRRPAE